MELNKTQKELLNKLVKEWQQEVMSVKKINTFQNKVKKLFKEAVDTRHMEWQEIEILLNTVIVKLEQMKEGNNND